MNNQVYKIVAATVIGVVTLCSCEKEITYKGESKDPLLVVNSVNEADSVIRVRLERSRFFLESSGQNFNITSGAALQLTDQTSGASYSVGTPDAQGVYVFPVTAQQNHTYSLSVMYPDYPVANAQMTVPAAVTISDVDTVFYVNQGQLKMKGTLKWQDPAGKDFYILKMSLVQMDAQGTIEYPDQSIASYDQSMNELSSSGGLGGDENYMQELFFTDELFDGTNKSLEIRYIPFVIGSQYHYKFTLYRCTEDVYKYLVSTQKSMNADGDFFAEPVKVFTNMDHGYGIFSVLTRTEYML